jgi:hypothetical protein
VVRVVAQFQFPTLQTLEIQLHITTKYAIAVILQSRTQVNTETVATGQENTGNQWTFHGAMESNA